MAEATLQINIARAGDPEKLGALLKAALAAQETPPPREVVPMGYRCQECWAADGGHERSCSIGVMAAGRSQNVEPEGGEG